MPGHIIARQIKGGFSDTEHQVDCDTTEQARSLYIKARSKLLDVNRWPEISAEGSTEFSIYDNHGLKVERPVRIGDYIRINIPGPGPRVGDGYDWVRILNLDEVGNTALDIERIIMVVQPSSNPNSGGTDTAHFFTSEARSHFIVRRDGLSLRAAVLGRNELPNASEAGGIDKLRNSIVGASAITGIAKIQWKLLVTALLS